MKKCQKCNGEGRLIFNCPSHPQDVDDSCDYCDGSGFYCEHCDRCDGEGEVE